MRAFDVAAIRADFPILKQQAHGHNLVYLDNAATTQKPQIVIDTMTRFYQYANANVHRGVHLFSERATKAYEEARAKVRGFINAKEDKEIIFVRGTTEAINLVAQSFGYQQLQAGDEIIITALEHHSNIVPWQVLCEHTGARLKVAPINDAGEVLFDAYQQLFTERTRLVAVTHIANALGTINPIKAMIDVAKAHQVPVLVDGAQALLHGPVDVQQLDCDFYAFSGHKLFGPTGVGVLYGKKAWLEQMPPYQTGGNMIRQVSFTQTTYADLPYKFEAGTPNIVGVIGLGAAIDYLQPLDWQAIAAYERQLLDYATEQAAALPGLRLIGTAKDKVSILSFVLQQAHPHDVGTILDHQGIAVRAGHHCAMPLMERLQVPATVRASFAFYNTFEEVDLLIAGIRKVQAIFG